MVVITFREALNEKSRQGMDEQRKADQELQVGRVPYPTVVRLICCSA